MGRRGRGEWGDQRGGGEGKEEVRVWGGGRGGEGSRKNKKV